uniref:Ribosomal RNA-processing protein 40 n=1 Tax=Syphacia muris TaxID=451379 RepID=A0A0N5A8N1_9BILA
MVGLFLLLQLLGRGIAKSIGCENELVAVQPGIRKIAEGKQWLNIHSRRYVPQNGDTVIGIIAPNSGSEMFKVDIGAVDYGYVNFLSFEGKLLFFNLICATKRNRPTLKTGDLIYARVISASKHSETELTCIDAEGRARGMGLLPSHGFVFRCSINLVNRILSPSSSLLSLIGYHLKFEIACGANGRIWIAGKNSNEISAICRIIRDSEFIKDSDIPDFIDKRIGILNGMDVE